MRGLLDLCIWIYMCVLTVSYFIKNGIIYKIGFFKNERGPNEAQREEA